MGFLFIFTEQDNTKLLPIGLAAGLYKFVNDGLGLSGIGQCAASKGRSWPRTSMTRYAAMKFKWPGGEMDLHLDESWVVK